VYAYLYLIWSLCIRWKNNGNNSKNHSGTLTYYLTVTHITVWVQFYVVASLCVVTCTNSSASLLVTSSQHCPRFTGLSCWTTCFDQTGHHQTLNSKMYSSCCTYFMQIFYGTLNIDNTVIFEVLLPGCCCV